MSIKLSVDTLYNGGLGEKISTGLNELIANILDPNTDPKKKRTLTIKLEVTPNEHRNLASLKASTSTTLAPPQPIETNLTIVENLKTGEVYCEELAPAEHYGQASFEGTFKKGKLAQELDDETVYRPTHGQQ